MSDAFRPITTSQRLDNPRGYRLFTTQREVPAEFTPPNIGDPLGNFLPGSLSSNLVLSVSDSPRDGKQIVTVRHGLVPEGPDGGEAFVEYESFAYRFPPIYPNSTPFFPGGSQDRNRVVPARVVYEYAKIGSSKFNTWRDASTIWDFTDPTTGPFEVKSYIADAAAQKFTGDDGSAGVVGQFLAPAFIAQDTINNSLSISSPGSLFYTVGASSPSATAYAAWVAARTEIIASRTISKWMGNIYCRRTVWVRAQ